MSEIQDKAAEMLGGLKEKAGDVAEGLHHQSENLADKVGDVAEGVLGKEKADQVEKFLTTDVGAVAGDIAEAAGGLFGKLKDAAGGLVDKAKDALDGDDK